MPKPPGHFTYNIDVSNNKIEETPCRVVPNRTAAIILIVQCQTLCKKRNVSVDEK